MFQTFYEESLIRFTIFLKLIYNTRCRGAFKHMTTTYTTLTKIKDARTMFEYVHILLKTVNFFSQKNFEKSNTFRLVCVHCLNLK